MKLSASNAAALSVEHVERRILQVRGHKVMLDSDLAQIYGVLTERLNEQVRRNVDRFPSDFAFRLTPDEYASLIPQIAGSNKSAGRRGSKSAGRL